MDGENLRRAREYAWLFEWLPKELRPRPSKNDAVRLSLSPQATSSGRSEQSKPVEASATHLKLETHRSKDLTELPIPKSSLEYEARYWNNWLHLHYFAPHTRQTDIAPWIPRLPPEKTRKE